MPSRGCVFTRQDIFVGTSYDLFVFKQNRLIRSYKNGHSVPVELREVKTQPIRFLLEPSSEKIIYLIRVKSNFPAIPIFTFGNFEEIEPTWSTLNNIMLISYFIGLSFLVYNMILFFVTKDKSFIYYCVYISGLLLICVSGRSYLPFGLTLPPQMLVHIMTTSLIMTSIGIALFTTHFLNLKSNLPSIAKQLNTASFILVFSVPLPVYADFLITKILFLFSVFYLIVTIFYAGYTSYKNGNRIGLYFLISTGIGSLFIMLFMIAFYVPGTIPVETWNLTLVNQALIWDVITLSIALAYRIRLLQEEKEAAQHVLAQKAKFTAIGETIGNIAHQWRQPLGQLSSINAKLEFSLMMKKEISQEELHTSIALNKKILEHLSQTIETFQNYFSNKTVHPFDIVECVEEALSFMEETFESIPIQTKVHFDKRCFIDSDEKAFLQVLIILLTNAKDAILENHSTDPMIDIRIVSNNSNVTLTIEDNGGGIKFDPIEKIFEPYITTKGLEGMGIGLFTAKSILEERMEGSLKAKNTDNGALFEIKLNISKN